MKNEDSKVLENTVTRNREPNIDLMAKGYINLYYANKEAKRKEEEAKDRNSDDSK